MSIGTGYESGALYYIIMTNAGYFARLLPRSLSHPAMTVTIMESYDAQMADYQIDHDVPMHLSSSDPWFQDLLPMEDDLTFHQKGVVPDMLPAIEVDMEAYVEDEHIEYEMADENHVHSLASDELLDVDVLDASAVQSPLLAVTSLTPSIEYPQPPKVTDQYPIAEVSLPNPGSQESFPGAAPLSEESLPDRRDIPGERIPVPRTTSEQEGLTMLQPDATQLPVGPTVEISSRQEGNAIADTANFYENNHQVDSYRLSQNLEQSIHVPDAALSTVNHSEAPAFLGDRSESPSRSAEVVEPTSPQNSATDEVSRESEEPRPVSGNPEHLQELSGPKAVHDFLHEKDSSNSQSAGETIENFNEVLNEALEEIHEDIPPPILLSIFSTDQPELCLFSKHSDPLPNDDETQERHILFQQAISLYYEPLVNAFEALRQDEYVSTVLEVTGNELGLEAYELDLTITEVYLLSKCTSADAHDLIRIISTVVK